MIKSRKIYFVSIVCTYVDVIQSKKGLMLKASFSVQLLNKTMGRFSKPKRGKKS